MEELVIGILDLETTPLEVLTWGLRDQHISLEQMEKDYSILSYALKILGKKKVSYYDQRNEKNVRDDKKLIKRLAAELNKIDVLITQNGEAFDYKRIKARLLLNGQKPVKAHRHIDILKHMRKHFGFASHKLAYVSGELCPKNKKSEHKKFPGLSLWRECLRGNKKAFKELEKYNIADVITTEKVYIKIRPFIKALNFNTYYKSLETVCSCGNAKFHKNGFALTETGKYQRYECSKCGNETRDGVNLLSKSKRKSLRK